MTKDWLKTTAAAGLAFSLLAAPAIAQEAWSDWNVNSDTGIDANEFNTGFDGAGIYDKWDANDDGNVSQDEWNAAIGDNSTAFNERFGETAWDDWDADDNDMLTNEEFQTGAFGAYDDNDDNYIDEPEFGDYGDDIGDGGFWDV